MRDVNAFIGQALPKTNWFYSTIYMRTNVWFSLISVLSSIYWRRKHWTFYHFIISQTSDKTNSSSNPRYFRLDHPTSLILVKLFGIRRVIVSSRQTVPVRIFLSILAASLRVVLDRMFARVIDNGSVPVERQIDRDWVGWLLWYLPWYREPFFERYVEQLYYANIDHRQGTDLNGRLGRTLASSVVFWLESDRPCCDASAASYFHWSILVCSGRSYSKWWSFSRVLLVSVHRQDVCFDSGHGRCEHHRARIQLKKIGRSLKKISDLISYLSRRHAWWASLVSLAGWSSPPLDREDMCEYSKILFNLFGLPMMHRILVMVNTNEHRLKSAVSLAIWHE